MDGWEEELGIMDANWDIDSWLSLPSHPTTDCIVVKQSRYTEREGRYRAVER